MRRILVCGGRHYNDRAFMFSVLDKFSPEVVIHGGCSGADSLAKEWAILNGKQHVEFLPDWSIGRAAGPLRNQRMLDEGKPDMGLVFPGGRGTADMLRRLRKAGITVAQYVQQT